jgi:hypothetical protein
MIFAPTWEKPMVLDQTWEILISPFVSDAIVVVSLVIMLPIED